MISAITFDLDDTFWDNSPVMATTEPGHYQWLNERVGHAERFPLEEYQRRRMALAERYPLRRGDFNWLRHQSLTAILVDFGYDRDSASRWADDTLEHMLDLRHEVTIFDEVPALLIRLREAGLRLGAITNGNVDLQRLAIAEYFEVIIKAGVALAPKPDARCFLSAMARLGARAPGEVMHVGDSWAEDALPAQRLGMQVAWIDVHQRGVPEPCPPGIHRLAHIRELAPLLVEQNLLSPNT
ncbi:HAD family hydrolase [Kushneria aurantia]|uniref:HAD family hydrolase n=1 Tax=Kushneria aurantia TaxID=504092 RepID=A0ABV6G271_9GAMM|nr:HAD-IA family hydrolase [Kushneria aurantia]